MFRSAAATILTLCLSSLTASAADDLTAQPTTASETTAMAAIDFDASRLVADSRPGVSFGRMTDRPVSRPGVLPALYVSLSALQAFDVYSTRQALAHGAHEANPVMSGIVTNPVAFTAVKAATAVIPMLIAERMWKTNRLAAVLTMVAANSAMAIVAANNARVLQQVR